MAICVKKNQLTASRLIMVKTREHTRKAAKTNENGFFLPWFSFVFVVDYRMLTSSFSFS